MLIARFTKVFRQHFYPCR